MNGCNKTSISDTLRRAGAVLPLEQHFVVAFLKSSLEITCFLPPPPHMRPLYRLGVLVRLLVSESHRNYWNKIYRCQGGVGDFGCFYTSAWLKQPCRTRLLCHCEHEYTSEGRTGSEENKLVAAKVHR